MENLPIEISCQIFRLLPQKDKLECMVVCRKWQRTINSTVLFDTLRITSKKGLRSAITRVTEEPSYGKQVKCLLVKVKPDNDFDVSLLPKLFPNVEDCHLNRSISLGTFQPWHSKLRRFIDMDDDRIESLIKSSTWSKLTTLELAARDKDPKSYFSMLTNTPALTHLELFDMDLTLSDFEFLHDTAPLLASISLPSMDFIGSDPLMDVVPASSVTSLSITDSVARDSSLRKVLLFYISRKYPCLSELSFDIECDGPIGVVPTDITCDEWCGVLTNLPPCLKKLEISLLSESEYNDVRQALHKNDCKLKSLTLYTQDSIHIFTYRSP